ncbi:hypothetical protein [Oleispirillum naphthae]|uniref:hypothetical protein n=1 Tax=Oleispirillum naphthae TaxID=2838853 RepID=UPI0030826615
MAAAVLLFFLWNLRRLQGRLDLGVWAVQIFIPFAVTVVSALLWRLRRPLFGIAFLLAAIGGGELFCALLWPPLPPLSQNYRTSGEWLDYLDARSAKLGVKKGVFDRRSMARVVRDLRKEGVEAYLWRSREVVTLGNGQRVLFSGALPYSLAVHCNEEGAWVTTRTDRYGFRNPDALWDAAPPIDALFVGGSPVEGACRPDGETFIDVFRERFPLTLGLGNGVIQASAQKLAFYAPKYRPRHIFVLFNFPYLAMVDAPLPAATPYEELAPELRKEAVERNRVRNGLEGERLDAAIAKFDADLIEKRRLSRLSAFGRATEAARAAIARDGFVAFALDRLRLRSLKWHYIGYVPRPGMAPAAAGLSWPSVERVMAELAGIARTSGSRLHLIGYCRLGGDCLTPEAAATLRAMGRRMGFDLIDVGEMTQRNPDMLVVHPTRQGSREIAERLIRDIGGR